MDYSDDIPNIEDDPTYIEGYQEGKAQGISDAIWDHGHGGLKATISAPTHDPDMSLRDYGHDIGWGVGYATQAYHLNGTVL